MYQSFNPIPGIPNLLNRQPMSREQELLAQQMGYVPRKQKLSEVLDDDEVLFRFGYVPFVIIEVAWDYVDSIFNQACILRLTECKRLCRAIKEHRAEYCRMRAEVYHGAQQHEESNMLLFQEELSSDFSKIYHDCLDAVVAKYPDIDTEYAMLVASVYTSRIVFSAAFEYAEQMRGKVQQKAGRNYEVNSILPPQVKSIFDLVIEFVGDCPLDKTFTPIYDKHVKNLVQYIHDIKFK